MDVVWHPDIEKDLKHLKRFPTAKKSLEAWERLFIFKGLKEMTGIEGQYPGFGDKQIYKAYVVALQENVGKIKGYRVIFQLLDDACYILGYVRHPDYQEKDLIALIKIRSF